MTDTQSEKDNNSSVSSSLSGVNPTAAVAAAAAAAKAAADAAPAGVTLHGESPFELGAIFSSVFKKGGESGTEFWVYFVDQEHRLNAIASKRALA